MWTASERKQIKQERRGEITKKKKEGECMKKTAPYVQEDADFCSQRTAPLDPSAAD